MKITPQQQEYNRQYAAKHAVKLRVIRRQKYLENREKILAKNAKWAAENRGARLAYFRKIAKTPKRKQLCREWERKNIERVRATKRAYSAKHAKKLSAYWKKYRADHPEKTKAHNKASWHRRRAMIAKATINLTAIKKFFLLVKSKESVRCYYCQNQTSTNDVHFDHIIPLSKGGPHAVENLCASCSKCNLQKQDKLIGAWIRIGQQLLNL